MKSIKEKQKEAFTGLKEKMGYTNPMQAPRLEKVVINAGVGSFKDKKKIETVEDRLSKLTGQKVAKRGAKKSIAIYKTRQGDTVGAQVTLRGPRMYGFLDKLLNVAFPRTRDFRGISANSIDEIGNITIGVQEHTIFPEAVDEDLRDVFGMGITVVTTAKSKAEARAFFDYLGFPFKKNEEARKK
ncbi:MAG: 50S ribosomal protein L5 [Candidatus Taylorbacteria bacterium CG11_big_fil_rev_8_21_14_0_20_46_11]|uniref:Large ribosomal subunit protein uL5 n=1 Tax=Candidatus Taylorbacteria bacterium CG11_big_fil_rev_8_21_14_0_20_46_11 TaxID=1975025 RepID=A0A2H0KCZ5_9BACT|nr:MAG: 50S ribosomal protein L5 [Candidatus Taylorbacteria bacterium CG11_big_fil_rev_8_21_14_0_20_46_11]